MHDHVTPPRIVVEGYTVVDLDALTPQPLQHPPARRADVEPRCLCGKKSIYAHGGMSCDEILDMRARIEFDERPRRARLIARLLGREPAGWRVNWRAIRAAEHEAAIARRPVHMQEGQR